MNSAFHTLQASCIGILRSHAAKPLTQSRAVMTDTSARHQPRSSIRHVDDAGTAPKVLLVIGDGTEVLDTMGPYYRLGEEYTVALAAPEVDSYNTVIHEFTPGWDVTRELQGYRLESDIAFRDVDPDDYVALVLPGGRAPEYLRYDEDLLRITRSFFDQDKPVASICHGIEILGVAGVLKGRRATSIPKCRFDVEVCGGIFVDEPVVRCGNLVCARGKKDISQWMRVFVPIIEEFIKRP